MVAEEVRLLAERFGLWTDPHAYVWQLSVGEQQRVEILKALSQGAELLILDEPTAVLTPQESAELFEILRSMTARGLTIIFITHKLEEVMASSDRVTVPRSRVLLDTRLIHDSWRKGCRDERTKARGGFGGGRP